MPKFKEGDIVYFTIPLDMWDDSLTVIKCGDGGRNMSAAVSGFPMEVKRIKTEQGYNSVYLHAPEFGIDWGWWFHEDDLEFFNLSLENK